MAKKPFHYLFLTVFFTFNVQVTNAKLVQILHTNDTHSFLDNTSHELAQGGAARLKSLMDFYKKKMADEGVKTLIMDAGDFAEGNLYYMADLGRKAFQVHNEMGYDVGALGNHDYLMGGHDLDKILGELDSKFPLIAANLNINPNYKNIKNKIKPYHEFDVDGIKIAVLGLTTNEIFYRWRFEAGKITNPYKTAKHYEALLKDRKNDFIIALTHIGVLNDIKLAERTKFIDLVVGGHSHTSLFKPSYGTNKRNRSVPVVQAGMNTEFLGRLIVDLKPGEPLKIVSYDLIPVKYEASDLKVKSLVEEAGNDLDTFYGKEWLNKKIGISDLKSNDLDGSRKWAYFVTDAMKEQTDSDVAIHTPLLNSENFPIGTVTRRDIFNSVPRIFDFADKYGWSIYTTKIKGLWLGLAFEALSHFGQPLTFSGITMESRRTEFGIKIKRLLINGKPLNPAKYYKVALSEGIIRGAKGISAYTTTILHNPIETRFKIWSTLEEKLASLNNASSIDKVKEDNHHYYAPNQNAELVD